MQFLPIAQEAAESISTELVFGEFSPGQLLNLGLLIAAIAVAVGVLVLFIFSSMVKTLHRRTTETRFKRELLDRGYSVDDVIRLVEATSRQDVAKLWGDGDHRHTQ